MRQSTAELQPGQVRVHRRIPLSDDWLRWDPERIHHYPDESDAEDKERERGIVARSRIALAHAPRGSLARAIAPRQRPPKRELGRRVELTMAHLFGIGFLVGLGVGLMVIGLGAILGS